MALIRHAFTSGRKSDDGQTDRARPVDWNDFHTVDPATFLQSHLSGGATGLELLGTGKVAVAANSLSLTVAARKELLVMIFVTGTSASSQVQIRFNSDTGPNYWDYLLRGNAAIAGIASVAQTRGTLATGVRLHADASIRPRIALLGILNRLDRSKPLTLLPQAGGGSATALARPGLGQAEWVNTSAQITTLSLHADATVNLNIGTVAVVFGRNTP